MAERLPNIVWIQCDDMSRDVGTYGRTPGVKTPNIDRLADEGMRFDRAYSTAPTCAPSRSAQLTGHYMTAVNGQHHHSTPEYPPHVKHLAERLKEVGYFAANISKNKPGLPEIGWGKLDYCWSRNTADEFYQSDDYADLEENQPFYAEFQTIEPHLPWHSLAKYAEVGLAVDPDEVELPPFYPDTAETREEWARYLSDVQVFDAKVGMVIQMLEEDGLLEDTIVIVVADHGRDMVRAKFALYDDGIHIPLIVRIPEKYQPEGYTPGEPSDKIVSGVDLVPSILAALGLEVPDDLPGIPFFGSERGERDFAFAHRDRVGSHIDRSRAVVNHRYHYVRNFMPNQPGYWPAALYPDFQLAYDKILDIMIQMRGEGALTPEQETVVAEVRPEEELFDLQNDPHTLHNLADDPVHVDAMRQMRTEMRNWISSTQDKGFLPEDPVEAQKGAWVVPLWLQLTEGKYDVDDYDVFALPVDDTFRDMLR